MERSNVTPTGTSRLCENVLKIENSKDRIQIERVHRIGNRSAGKIRPIIAKFVLSGHKAIVKSALSGVNLNASPYNGDFKVNDQFQPEVISYRRELFPKLIQERKRTTKLHCCMTSSLLNRTPEKGVTFQ